MDRNKNESHIGGDDLFGDTELTAEEKIAAAEADLAKAQAEMAEARAQAAEGGKTAGDARTAGDKQRRVEGVLRGDPEPKPTANEEVGYLGEINRKTTADIQDAYRDQADAAEAARAEALRRARDERIRAQEAINKRNRPLIEETLGDEHPTPGERNIAASKEHTAREKEWDAIIARGRDGEPVEPPMKTADTVPEARERLKRIIAEQGDEPTK